MGFNNNNTNKKQNINVEDKVNVEKTLKEEYKEKLSDAKKNLLVFLKWLVFSVVTGIVVGLVGVLFIYAINFATESRETHSWLIFTLPVCGVLIVLLYRLFKRETDKGTNLVITAIRTNEEIGIRTAPLIFISSFLTHLGGGSSGREGAALQLGGSIGEYLGSIFKFDEKDRKIMIMSGMSAAFSSVFGTPLAACIFPMEVVSVGIMYYAALVPCVISSLTAHFVALSFHVKAEHFTIISIPEFGVKNSLLIAFVAILCAVVSITFCELLHKAHHYIRLAIMNKILRIIASGSMIIVLSLIFGTDYNGIGTHVIERAINEGSVVWYAFILKMIFTAITLGTGYKGGEIVPSFFVGATFGCALGSLIGFSPSLLAACCLVGVFCGVTNSPMTSLFIAFELFGFEGMPYFLIMVSITYMLSGYISLYKSQKIVYSKTEPTYIDKNTH